MRLKSVRELSANGQFEVQEYKKPEYEVRVTPSKPRLLEGDAMQAVIDARYYFGQPVNGAEVEYAVYRDRYWFPLWYDPEDEAMTPQGDRGDDDSGDEISKDTGTLDADGKLTVNIPSQISEHRADYIYRIEARVTDQGNREITGKGWIVATYGSFVVNVSPDRYFYSPGNKITFTVQSRDYDNKPVNAQMAHCWSCCAGTIAARRANRPAAQPTSIPPRMVRPRPRSMRPRAADLTRRTSPRARPRAGSWKTTATSSSPAAA